jgi:hypothetical protein
MKTLEYKFTEDSVCLGTNFNSPMGNTYITLIAQSKTSQQWVFKAYVG